MELPVHGDGGSTRSFLYVEDVADAYCLILHKGIIGDTYNIGTQKERTVSQVARDIAAVFDMGEDKIVHVKDRSFNDRWAPVLGASFRRGNLACQSGCRHMVMRACTSQRC